MKSIRLVKDRSFYKTFFSIWSVLVLHNIITLGVNLLDNVMVSAYSEAAMAGVSAVNQVQFLFQQLMLGEGDAVVVLAVSTGGRSGRSPSSAFSWVASFWAARWVFCSLPFRQWLPRELCLCSLRIPPSMRRGWSTCGS